MQCYLLPGPDWQLETISWWFARACHVYSASFPSLFVCLILLRRLHFGFDKPNPNPHLAKCEPHNTASMG